MQLTLPLWRPTARPGAATSCLARRTEPGQWMRRDEAIMGTAIHVELWAERREQGDAAMDAVMAEMHRIDHRYSPHRPDSELSRINRDAAGAAVPLSEECYSLIERSLDFSALSGGAFDISYAAVGCLYDYRRAQSPDDTAVARARQSVGWQHLQLDPGSRSLRFGKPGMRIDLGGFAKGHAVEQAALILRARGIRSAYVAAGGDSRVLGERRGRPWSVAVRHPRKAGEVIAVLPLVDVAVSTSGDYERYFERGGVRFHHLLDPATGRSPSHLHSVTIVAPDGLTSEALSKSVFVLGLERGMALIERVPGVDAVVVDAAGALHFSSGLQRH